MCAILHSAAPPFDFKIVSFYLITTASLAGRVVSIEDTLLAIAFDARFANDRGVQYIGVI